MVSTVGVVSTVDTVEVVSGTGSETEPRVSIDKGSDSVCTGDGSEVDSSSDGGAEVDPGEVDGENSTWLSFISNGGAEVDSKEVVSDTVLVEVSSAGIGSDETAEGSAESGGGGENSTGENSTWLSSGSVVTTCSCSTGTSSVS